MYKMNLWFNRREGYKNIYINCNILYKKYNSLFTPQYWQIQNVVALKLSTYMYCLRYVVPKTDVRCLLIDFQTNLFSNLHFTINNIEIFVKLGQIVLLSISYLVKMNYIGTYLPFDSMYRIS